MQPATAQGPVADLQGEAGPAFGLDGARDANVLRADPGPAGPPKAFREAFRSVIEAFLAWETAVATAASPWPSDATGGDTSKGTPHAPDWPRTLAARSALVQAAVELRETLRAGLERPALDDLVLPPAVALDLVGVDSVHVRDVVLSIDVGGDDVYLNNAGGSNLIGGACATVGGNAVAALIDLGGDDHYVGGYSCGANGGCYTLGTPAAGFLLDAEGNDTYVAGILGTNGGGNFCAGFLLDGAGDDTYLARGGGANGGGSAGFGFLLDAAGNDVYGLGNGLALGFGHNGGGIVQGVGTLLDLAGDDRYVTACCGGNGGGAWGGIGLLLDAEGNDRYAGEDIAVNGGGRGGGAGALLDLSGDDAYSARDGAVNGGAAGATMCAFSSEACLDAVLGVGLLFDGGGVDWYIDEEGGSGPDHTVMPKGVAGAQVDFR